MKLEIIAKNYHMSDRLNQILLNKIKKLDKYFPAGDASAKVVLTDLGRQCKMELSISYSGQQVRSEVTGDTMYYNIDECLPKIERQIVKYRSRMMEKNKAPAFENDYEFVSDVDMKPVEIAKIKRFAIGNLTPVEAAENLEMVGHDFYLFLNSNTGNVEAVYRRKDGTIGLLQPYEE